MRLYFVRHGIAEHAAPGQRDAERALTPRGIHRLKVQGRVLVAGSFPVTHLFSSPYRRAQETAAVLGEALEMVAEVDQLLAPGATFDDIVELLHRVPGDAHVMLVGHQPDLSYLIYQATGARVSMQPGSLAVVELPVLRPNRGELRALFAPDAMVQMAT